MVMVQTARKPPPYFLKRIVIIITQLPPRPTLLSVDYVGRVVKRNVVLGASGVRRVPQAPDKGLILAGLVVQSAGSPTEREVNGQAQVLDKTKVLHGPRTQACGETRHSKSLSAR